MLRTFALTLLVSLSVPLTAVAQQPYRVEGTGGGGDYSGHVLLHGRQGSTCQVAYKIVAADGTERRGEAVARLHNEELDFGCALSRDGLIREVALRCQARRQGAGWLVRWTDAQGHLVRRERWIPLSEITIEVAVVAVTDGVALAGVSLTEARAAQREILSQLSQIYGPLGLRFEAALSEPAAVPGDQVDLDHDGRLSREEVELLRDLLEQSRVKRAGRIVVSVTQAPFVGHGSRGWTLGDAPATPGTLEDLNDNFSLVALRCVGPEHHTVAHEVGHQLGLDDLGRFNRGRLVEPHRDDHLMVSGGEGFHLDAALAARIRERAQFPDHGLRGRRQQLVRTPEASEILPRADGLPQPAMALERR